MLLPALKTLDLMAQEGGFEGIVIRRLLLGFDRPPSVQLASTSSFSMSRLFALTHLDGQTRFFLFAWTLRQPLENLWIFGCPEIMYSRLQLVELLLGGDPCRVRGCRTDTLECSRCSRLVKLSLEGNNVRVSLEFLFDASVLRLMGLRFISSIDIASINSSSVLSISAIIF